MPTNGKAAVALLAPLPELRTWEQVAVGGTPSACLVCMAVSEDVDRLPPPSHAVTRDGVSVADSMLHTAAIR